jgi:adenine-specific DNA-methyltransferase
MTWDDMSQKWIVEEEPLNGELAVWPVDPKGENRIWRVNSVGARRAINDGEISVIEKAGRQEVSKKSREPEGKKPKTLWADSKYSATTYGSKLLLDILGSGLSFSYPKSIHLTKDAIRYWTDYSSVILDFFSGSGTTGHAVISLNREDDGHRKYILVEQAEYFDIVMKPRIQKVVYSAEWKDGKATAPQTGISHTFKVLKIESYEDTLNNLQLRRTAQQQELLDTLPKSAQEDYLLRYLLDIESRGSLLSVEQFKKPFDYKLKVTVDSAGAYEVRAIDLVETFNYLIGLRVKHIDMQRDRGFVLVTGWLPNGGKTLVLWRDAEQVDYETLNRLCDKLAINPADSEFEVVYINGDHNIPAVFTSTEAEGGMTKTLKIRQIEPEFLSRMFAVEGI